MGGFPVCTYLVCVFTPGPHVCHLHSTKGHTASRELRSTVRCTYGRSGTIPAARPCWSSDVQGERLTGARGRKKAPRPLVPSPLVPMYRKRRSSRKHNMYVLTATDMRWADDGGGGEGVREEMGGVQTPSIHPSIGPDGAQGMAPWRPRAGWSGWSVVPGLRETARQSDLSVYSAALAMEYVRVWSTYEYGVHTQDSVKYINGTHPLLSRKGGLPSGPAPAWAIDSWTVSPGHYRRGPAHLTHSPTRRESQLACSVAGLRCCGWGGGRWEAPRTASIRTSTYIPSEHPGRLTCT